MIKTLLFLLASTCWAQSLPANIVCAFGSYSTYGSPKFAGGLSYGTRVSSSQAIYSYTSVDFVRTSSKPLGTSTRTGVAALFRQWGGLSIFALGTGGLSTTATATQGSFSGGGLIAYQFKPGWALIADFQQSNTSGKTARAGFAYTWGK